MNDDHHKIIEMCEKIARLEKTINNGFSEDIAEIKQDLKTIRLTIDELKQGITTLKTGQSIQWFLIASIITGFIALFIKR
jgi:prefoldin subunit 5